MPSAGRAERGGGRGRCRAHPACRLAALAPDGTECRPYHATVNAPAETPRARRGPVVFFCALIGEFACLLWALKAGDLSIPGHPARLVGALLGAGVCFLAAVRFFPKGRAQNQAVLFWFVAIALRVVLLPMEPGDDLWRYLWEGRIQREGFNPYRESPDSTQLVTLREDGWWKINHPESAAIYPPATELTFAALARIVPAAAQSVASVILFKIVFILADLGTASLLLLLLRSEVVGNRRGAEGMEGSTEGKEDAVNSLCVPPTSLRATAVKPSSYRNAAWYAWNPAVAYACAGAGHFDSLMLLTLTAAVLALDRATAANETRPAWSWSLASAAGLGLAIAFKLIPIFLLPVWLFALRRRAAALLVSLAIPAALTLPYGGPGVVLKPLLAFADVTRFNDLVWGWIEAVTIPNPVGRNWPFTLALALAVATIVWKFRADWRRSALWVLGAVLLLSPTLHPWYVLWILPLAVWRGQTAWTILSLSVLTALLLWETTTLWTAWQPNMLTRSMVVLPPLIAWLALRKQRSTSNFQRPTFNETAPSNRPR